MIAHAIQELYLRTSIMRLYGYVAANSQIVLDKAMCQPIHILVD